MYHNSAHPSNEAVWLYYNIYCSSASNLFHVNDILTIYSTSDRGIYKLTLEHLKRKSKYSLNFQLDMGFPQHIEFLSFITMIIEIPELYLKAVVLTVEILHVKV